MDRALWLLIQLQLRGWLRSLGRSLRSPKGLLLALLGLIVFIPWLLVLLTSRNQALSAENVRTTGPAFLLAYCFMNVLLSSGERAVYFSPAEVTFLFTGPFSRRQLLGYKVAVLLLFTLPTTLFLTAVFRAQTTWFLASFVGLMLMTMFMQLFGMALSLAASAVGVRLFSRARKLVLAALLLGVVVLLRPIQEQGIDGVLSSYTWLVLSTPLRWFYDAILADSWRDLFRYGTLGLLVNLLLLFVVFSLDANYLEASSAYSSRVYAQIQRLRGGPTVSGGSDSPSPPAQPRRGLPMLPRLGGIGPVVWRQLTTVMRSPGRLVGLVVIQAVFVGVMLSVAREAGGGLVSIMITGVIMMSLFTTTMLPFDFRGDLDRLEALKTLPLPPWRLALGQIATPALILGALQWVMLGGLAAVEYVRAPAHNAAHWAELLWLLAGAAIVVPINFLLFGLENVLFLLLPSRLMATTPGDFQTIGRNVLLMLVKMLTFGLVGGLASLVGWVAFMASGQSALLALAAVWIVLADCAAILVPVAGLAFTRIDLSRDKPT